MLLLPPFVPGPRFTPPVTRALTLSDVAAWEAEAGRVRASQELHAARVAETSRPRRRTVDAPSNIEENLCV